MQPKQSAAPSWKENSRFVEFNMSINNYLLCISKIDFEDLKSKSESQVNAMCKSDKKRIQEVLNSNSMTMSNIVKDRLHYFQQEYGANM